MIDANWVKATRAWVKRTFVVRKYKSAADALAYVRHLRAELERLYVEVFYAKGQFPRDNATDEFEKLSTKLAIELDAAATQLDDSVEYVAWIIGSVTPGTIYSERRPEIAREFDTDEKLRELFYNVTREHIEKCEAILSGKFLRAVTSFLTWVKATFGYDFFNTPRHELQYSIGRATVVYDASRSEDRDALRRRSSSLGRYVTHLREAKRLLDRKGFGFLWYGTFFMSCPTCGGVNPLGDHYGVGAHYITRYDRIVSFVKPDEYLTKLIIHELGHRYYFKFMSAGDRARFDSYFGEVGAVSDYGSTDPQEDFAEVFSHYVTGEDLTRDQIERFRQFLAGSERRNFVANGRRSKARKRR